MPNVDANHGQPRDPMEKRFYAGLDLGRVNDWTALVIAEQHRFYGLPSTYDLVHLERTQAPYPDVVTSVVGLLWDLYRAHHTKQPAHLAPYRADIEPTINLVIDQTGVGVAVVDLFRREELPGNMVAVTITGGDSATKDGDVRRVPKRDLAGIVQVLLQGKRLRYPTTGALIPILQHELLNFKAKISLSGHDSYGAGEDWRKSNHDDLVLAASLALWEGENGGGDWDHITDPEVLRVLGNWGI